MTPSKAWGDVLKVGNEIGAHKITEKQRQVAWDIGGLVSDRGAMAVLRRGLGAPGVLLQAKAF